jgi:hypothetical protein
MSEPDDNLVRAYMTRFLNHANEMGAEQAHGPFIAAGMLTAAIEAYGQTQGGPHATVAWLRDVADRLEAEWSKGPRAV